MGSTLRSLTAGLNVDHLDLTENVLKSLNHDYSGLGELVNPRNTHGTSVAGLIAARDNDIGIRGVAPRATLYAYNLIARRYTADNEIDAMTRNMLVTAVSNNSWGFPDFAIPYVANATWVTAVELGINEGYVDDSGPSDVARGVSYVWAAGNGHRQRDNSNLDGRANHYAIIAACAVNYADRRSSYSEKGANLWVCGPSHDPHTTTNYPAITTTVGDDRYTHAFGGTSAATPIVAGVVALIRAANPDLTWRDVKLILASSARKNDSANRGWQTGALKYGSSTERYSFNHEYGFGVVDAKAAVDLANGWTNLPTWRNSTVESSGEEQDIPDGSPGRTIESSLTIDKFVEFIEFVEINVNIRHSYFRDLEVQLVSPTGSISELSTTAAIGCLRQDYNEYDAMCGYDGAFRFGSARHLGENSVGIWKLRVTDRQPGDSGTLRSWDIKFYGHGITPGEPKFSSSAPGDQSMTVNWQAPPDIGRSDVTKYDARVTRSDGADKSDGRWTTHTDITTTAQEFTNLDPGVYYDIQMRAHNNGGAGVWSKTVQGNTDSVAPATLRAPSVTPRATELLVTWTPPRTGQVGISSYDVRHILSSDTPEQKEVDTNWTEAVAWATAGGDLKHIIDNLTDGASYDVQVRATNGQGTTDWSSTRTGTPRVSNHDPMFPSNETGAHSLYENTPAGRNIGAAVQATDPNGDPLTYDLTGSDAAHFEINKVTGQLQTLTPFDYEGGTTTYSVNVVVSDNKDVNAEDDPSVDATQPVTITVENVNEAPVVSGTQYFDFREDRGHWEVGNYSASDPEDDMITWSLSGPDVGDFQIDQSGNLSFRQPPDADRPADQDRDNQYEVNVVASDGSLQGELDVTVSVQDVNEPPVITGATDIDFPENSSNRVTIFHASDPEAAANPLIWSLNGSDADRFELRGSSRGTPRPLLQVGA